VLNLHWSWNHASDEIWESLDSEVWQTTQNPWVILRTVSREKIQSLLANPDFRQRLQSCQRHNHKSFTEEAWFQKKYPGSILSLVAYFSMEFMLTKALPIYSGRLGNAAGDQMKAASNLGVPVVGVGLLYGQGYFRQNFDLGIEGTDEVATIRRTTLRLFGVAVTSSDPHLFRLCCFRSAIFKYVQSD